MSFKFAKMSTYKAVCVLKKLFMQINLGISIYFLLVMMEELFDDFR